MEREGGLQDPVCQQPACERHCLAEVHHWQMSKSLPLHSTNPLFTPPFPSWSIFLFCLWAQRTQSLFKAATGKTYGAVAIKATVLPLCFSSWHIYKREATCHVTLYVSCSCIIATYSTLPMHVLLLLFVQLWQGMFIYTLWGNSSSSDTIRRRGSMTLVGLNQCQSPVLGVGGVFVMKLAQRSFASLWDHGGISAQEMRWEGVNTCCCLHTHTRTHIAHTVSNADTQTTHTTACVLKHSNLLRLADFSFSEVCLINI